MNIAARLEKILKQLPDEPGIYLFYSATHELIYVGKATSLKSRVRSYFRGPRTSRPIEQMMHLVEDIQWKTTDSVLEAIILEANYIKTYQPRYNIEGKDDKSWNYIAITNEPYPRVVTYRQHEVGNLKPGPLSSAQKKELGVTHLFGPYPGLNTKAAMKLLRKMFSLSDCQRHIKYEKRGKQFVVTKLPARPCLYRQMGLCLGVCTGEISQKEYKQKVIDPLIQFLQGGKKRLISTLKRRMESAAKHEAFEEAARLRNQITSLIRIHDMALINKSFVEDAIATTVARIEGYDISNLGASGKVGSMVVFDSQGPVKSEYRKFKIKTVVGQSDVDCLEEVLVRRLRHDDWPLPSVFLIDGGKPQVARAMKVLRAFSLDIPLVGIAKGPERKKNEFIFGSRQRAFIGWVDSHQELLVRVRDEAHRFAITYQRKTRKLKK